MENVYITREETGKRLSDGEWNYELRRIRMSLHFDRADKWGVPVTDVHAMFRAPDMPPIDEATFLKPPEPVECRESLFCPSPAEVDRMFGFKSRYGQLTIGDDLHDTARFLDETNLQRIARSMARDKEKDMLSRLDVVPLHPNSRIQGVYTLRRDPSIRVEEV